MSESDGTTSINYTYDDADNRISKTVNSVQTVYEVDKLNRVLSSTTDGTVDATYTYDTNGNRSSKTVSGVTHNYVYDRENRLVTVQNSGTAIFTATYDYRTRRMHTLDEGVEKSYIYDGGDCAQERDNAGSLTKQFIRGTSLGGGIGGILYKDEPSAEREYFLYNVIGSTVATTNPDASVKSTSLYEAFGKVVASTGTSDNNRLFCTKERSASIGLDNFGFRYFDWEIGRFIQRDPAGYPDGLNNYLYCSNNPINRIDPLGLDSKLNKTEKAVEVVKKVIPETVEKINGRLPRNAQFAGREDVKLAEINSRAKKETLEKYKDVNLKFTKEGLLDMADQAEMKIKLDPSEMKGDSSDKAKAIEKIKGNERLSEKYSKIKDLDAYQWNHGPDGEMQLVPADLHSAVSHTGFAAKVREGLSSAKNAAKAIGTAVIGIFATDTLEAVEKGSSLKEGVSKDIVSSADPTGIVGGYIRPLGEASKMLADETDSMKRAVINGNMRRELLKDN